MKSENTIRKEAQRLARADGKQLDRLPMIERLAYIMEAEREQNADGGK